MTPGTRVEVKLKPGLGNWQLATFVERRRDAIVVERDGTRYEVKPSKVRAIKTKSQERKERKCSYCGEVGHDIRSCERLVEMSKTMKGTEVSTITRPFTLDGMLTATPKGPTAIRSEIYLDFVRSQPCMWCGALAPSDPDHVGPHGLGQKTDDLRTVPACRECHGQRHDKGRVRPHNKLQTTLLIYQKQVDLLVQFFRQMGQAHER